MVKQINTDVLFFLLHKRTYLIKISEMTSIDVTLICRTKSRVKGMQMGKRDSAVTSISF